MSCCNNHLGSFPHSKDIDTGITVTTSGTYIYEWEFAGSKFRKQQIVNYISTPVPLIIPRPFNEDFTYKLKIIKPDGSYYTVNDCPNFTIRIFTLITDDCGDDCEFIYN